MNEQLARDVELVRAIETSDQKREILSDDDRLYASRSAKELAQWQAAESRSGMTLEHFLRHRSDQLIKRLGERYPGFAALYKRSRSMSRLPAILPLVALVSGAAVDRIANPHRVDLLSGPLLLIIVWNFVVYLWMLTASLPPLSRMRWLHADWLPSISLRKLAIPRRLPQALSAALLRFASEWASMSRRLMAARWVRALHLSAALLACGVILSLYARGMLTEYRVGWESTFLNADQVHRILSMLFAPALAVFPLQGFSVADIDALQFAKNPGGTGGARWVHLYAASLLLLVIVPRLLFAAIAHWRARRLTKNFPIDVQQSYFHRFNDVLGARAMTLRVLPYSFTVDERRDKGLHEIATMLFGQQARVSLRPSLTYGDDPSALLRDTSMQGDEATLTAVLFSLSATPEKEAHGAVLSYLVQHAHRGIAALVDESTYLERIGSQAGHETRLAERTLLWQEFCRLHRVPATIVNLTNPQARALDAGIKTSAAP